jgi:regulator of sigma E protease
MIIGTILWFLLVLSFLVVIHELGHFLAAKRVGVHVQEFGLGYPPRLRPLFKKWGTLFSLNAIPVGGFVKLYGDDAEQMAVEPEPGIPESRMFSRQTAAKRLIIILAGVVVNFLFGIIAFIGLFSAIGIPTPKGFALITEVTSGSPAELAGFQVGDQVVSFLADGQAEKIAASQRLIDLIAQHKGETVVLRVRRDSRELDLSPQLRAERPENDGLLGVGLEDTDLKFYPWWQMPFRGALQGLRDSFNLSRLVVAALGDMVVRLVTRGEIPRDITGPVGIVDQAIQNEVLKQGLPGALNFAGQLSVNLAIMNLLPIPALDGGRALFVVLERMIGRARRVRWEQKANLVGFIFLLSLILLVTAKDIINLFRP